MTSFAKSMTSDAMISFSKSIPIVTKEPYYAGFSSEVEAILSDGTMIKIDRYNRNPDPTTPMDRMRIYVWDSVEASWRFCHGENF